MIKRQISQILLLIILIMVMAAVYLPVRSKIIDQLEHIKTNFIVNWEKEYDINIKYRSASPTIINSLRIRDFSLSSSDRMNFSFNSDRISLYYGLRLFSRSGDRVNLRRIVLKRGMLYLNIPESDGAQLSGDPDKTAERVKEIISEYFPSAIVELRDVNVRVVYGGEKINWDINLLRLEADGDTVFINHKGFLEGRDSISSVISARGSLSTSLDLLNLSAQLEDFRSPFFDFDQLNFQIGLNGNEVRVSKVSDKFPMDFFLTKTGEIVKIQYQSEDFVPSRLFRPGTQWSEYAKWFDLSLDGSFQGTYDTSSKNPRYSCNLRIGGDNDIIHQYLGGYSSVNLNLDGRDWDVTSHLAELESPLGNFVFTGNIQLQEREGNGIFLVENGQLTPDVTLDSAFNLVMKDQLFTIKSDNLKFNGMDCGGLTLSGESQWERKNILANAVYKGVFADEVSLDIFAEYLETFEMKAWYNLQDFKPGSLMDTLSVQPSENRMASLLDEASLRSRGFIELKGKDTNLVVDALSLKSPEYQISAKGYGNEKKIVLSDILLESEGHRLDGSITGSMGDLSTLKARLTYNGTPYDFNAEWNRNDRLVSLTGTYGVSGELRYYDDKVFHINLSSDEIPLTWGENELGITLGISGMISSGDFVFNMVNNSIAIKDSPYVYPARMDFTGNLNKGTLNINQLVFSDDFSRLSGNGKLILPLNGIKQFNGWLTLKSDRTEQYKFLFYKEGTHYNGYGDMENFIAKRIKALDREGTISARLNFEDIPKNGTVKGSVSASLEEWGDLSCFLDINENRALLTDIRGSHGQTGFDSGILVLDRKAGDVTLSLGMNGIMAKKNWHSGLLVKGNSENMFHPDQANFTGELKTEEIVFDDSVVSPPLSFRIERKGEDLSLYNEDRRVWNSYYNLNDGQILVNTDKLLPLSFDMRGFLRKDRMDLTVSRINMDLQKANSFMPVDYASKQAMVEFDQGRLMGELTLEGTPESPRINGVFTMDPLQLNTAYSTKKKGVTRAAVDITDNFITIPYFEMAMGQTGVIGIKGEVLLDGWSIEDFNFDFDLIGKNGGAVPMLYPIRGLALKGEAEGSVSFYGTGQQYYIDGELLLDSLVMSLAQTPKKPRIPRNERPDPWDLKVDLSFITGKDVSMVVPNEDFHIIKAQLDIDQELRYQLDNIPWEFTLTGDLSVRTGDIAYFDKNFSLTEGKVTFDENQEGFDPFLDITAETSLQYQGGDVTLMIDYEGSLLGEFDPRFSSIPSYSERDILAMLEPFQAGDNSAIAVALGTYADKYTFSAPFEEGLKDVLNVDMVTIETGFLKNIIEDQLNSGQGVYTNESSQYNVARYLNDTYLNVGKYLGRDLFIAGGISVDYNENRTVMNGMGFDFNVTLEMETPFFNIGWTYLPDDLDSRSSSDGFISDSSITINFRL